MNSKKSSDLLVPSSSSFKRYPMPFVRLELAVFALRGGRLEVLLGLREGEPEKGKWALPGGVLRIDLDGSLEEAARRVANERLSSSLPYIRQLAAVGGPGRDVRSAWALSVVYRALVREGTTTLAPGKRMEALEWRCADDAASDPELAFDHADLLRDALAVMRAEIGAMHLPFECFPEHFTLGELQSWCEQILGKDLDKSSFRRKLDERDLVTPVPGEFRTGNFRPAQLFKALDCRSQQL